MTPACITPTIPSHPLQAAVLRCWPIRVLPTRPRAWPSTRSRLTDAASEVQARLPALLCRKGWRTSFPYVSNKCLFFFLSCHLWRHFTYSVLGGGDGNLLCPLRKPKPTLFLHVYLDPNQKVQNTRSLERGWTLLIWPSLPNRGNRGSINKLHINTHSLLLSSLSKIA